jgi:exonuclease VII large subunit
MRNEPTVVRSSWVPILACIAALLFSANFFQFLQKHFKKWWGWNFTCPTEHVVHHRHRIVDVKPDDRHVMIFDFKEHEIDHEMERAHRDLKRAEQGLRRNLERALREMERQRERMEQDGNADVHVERLQEEIETKARSLERLEQELRRMEHELERQEETHRRESIRIRVHR